MEIQRDRYREWDRGIESDIASQNYREADIEIRVEMKKYIEKNRDRNINTDNDIEE